MKITKKKLETFYNGRITDAEIDTLYQEVKDFSYDSFEISNKCINTYESEIMLFKSENANIAVKFYSDISKGVITFLEPGTKIEEIYETAKLHRKDGPAVIWDDGLRVFWENGRLLKKKKISKKGLIEFYQGNLTDSEIDMLYQEVKDFSYDTFQVGSGTAPGDKIIYFTSDIGGVALRYFDGPIIGSVSFFSPDTEFKDINKSPKNLHRKDGPAVIYTNGKEFYWENGIEMKKITREQIKSFYGENFSEKEIDILYEEVKDISYNNFQTGTEEDNGFELLFFESDIGNILFRKSGKFGSVVFFKPGTSIEKSMNDLCSIDDRYIHRENGPAVVYHHGKKEYYENGFERKERSADNKSQNLNSILPNTEIEAAHFKKEISDGLGVNLKKHLGEKITPETISNIETKCKEILDNMAMNNSFYVNSFKINIDPKEPTTINVETSLNFLEKNNKIIPTEENLETFKEILDEAHKDKDFKLITSKDETKSSNKESNEQPTLAKELDLDIRLRLARNYNLTPEIQLILAKDSNENIRRNLADNTNLTFEAQEILAKDPDLHTRYYLAQNPKLIPKVQHILAKDSDVYVRISLAENSNLVPEVQENLAKDLAKDLDGDVRRNLAKNPNLTPKVQLILAKDWNKFVKWHLASNLSLIPEVQIILSKSSDTDTRWYLAGNHNLIPEVQHLLTKDSSEYIRQFLASNPNLIPEVQKVLAKDSSTYVRRSLAYNPNLTTEIQLILAKDSHSQVRNRLSENPNLINFTVENIPPAPASLELNNTIEGTNQTAERLEPIINSRNIDKFSLQKSSEFNQAVQIVGTEQFKKVLKASLKSTPLAALTESDILFQACCYMLATQLNNYPQLSKELKISSLADIQNDLINWMKPIFTELKSEEIESNVIKNSENQKHL